MKTETISTRELYHAIRRHNASARYRPATISELKTCPIPRGAGAMRDTLARVVAAQRQPETPAPSLSRRLATRLARLAVREIVARGISTPAGMSVDDLELIERGEGCALFRVGYWYEYSKRHGKRYQAAVYLLGREDGQRWIIRPPSTVQTIREALEWTIPATVQHAMAAGRPVKRQGDFIFVGRKAGGVDLQALNGSRHEYRKRQDSGYSVTHPQHKALRLSGKFHWRAFPLRVDVSAAAGCGD